MGLPRSRSGERLPRVSWLANILERNARTLSTLGRGLVRAEQSASP